MDKTDTNKEEIIEKPLEKYTRKDLIHSSDTNFLSTIGKVVMSEIPSVHMWSFSKSTRKQTEKLGSLNKRIQADSLGRAGPGPIYNIKPNICQKKIPEWSFGNEKKNSKTIPPYHYYLINNETVDPMKAHKSTQKNSQAIKFECAEKVF